MNNPLSWQVGDMKELAAAKTALANVGALLGESDHDATNSIYAADPDGNEFEVMVLLPRDEWGALRTPSSHHAAPVVTF